MNSMTIPQQERQSDDGVSTDHDSSMWADDAGETVKTDEHAGVAADGVEQMHQRHG